MRKFKFYLAAGIFIFILPLHFKCKNEADKNRIIHQPYGIILASNTALRIDPLIFSGKIMHLNKGESVMILDTSKKKRWINKTNDYWYKIKTKTGFTGWTFGKNIKILSSKDKDSVNEIISDFMEDETEKLRKDLSGKWWSINNFGDFTNHCLEIYEDNKYKSYWKGQTKPIEGEFNFDFNKNEIVFLKGTSFKGNLTIVKRGMEYILKKEMDEHELRFKKIAIEVSPEPEIEKEEATGEENKETKKDEKKDRKKEITKDGNKTK